MRTLKLIISDGTASAALICFNRAFLEKSLPVGCIIVVTGTFTVKYGQIQSTAFDVTKLAESGALSDFENMPLPNSGIVPVYPLTEGLTQKQVRKTVAAAISQYDRGIETELPAHIIEKRELLPKTHSSISFPKSSLITFSIFSGTFFATKSMNSLFIFFAKSFFGTLYLIIIRAVFGFPLLSLSEIF